jgi:hypothetical protein
MPRKKTTEELQSTYVECLLYAFHESAHKVQIQIFYVIACFGRAFHFDNCATYGNSLRADSAYFVTSALFNRVDDRMQLVWRCYENLSCVLIYIMYMVWKFSDSQYDKQPVWLQDCDWATIRPFGRGLQRALYRFQREVSLMPYY